jgi:glycosyltransferase involved in cell wall biosynthesis
MTHNIKRLPEKKLSARSVEWPILYPPKVAVVITHYNYSNKIEGAIDSVLSQSYSNFELVVVDDNSDPSELNTLENLIEKYKPRIILKKRDQNLGQVSAFYHGIEGSDAEFCCALDPDDRYMIDFLEKMVYVHLNPYVYVPLVGCDQFLIANDVQITGTRGLPCNKESLFDFVDITGPSQKLMFYSPEEVSWNWANTSSIMFRRSIIDLLRPIETVNFRRQLDAYLSLVSSYVGGAIVYTEPLVIRCIHRNNSYITDKIISGYLPYQRHGDNFEDRHSNPEKLAAMNFLDNGGAHCLPRKRLERLINRCFRVQERIALYCRRVDIRHKCRLRKLLGF